MSTIAPDNALGLFASLVAIVPFSLWLERRFELVRRISVIMPVVVIPMLLAAIGVIPRAAPVYNFVSDYFVLIAVPLLLFNANLSRIFLGTGKMLLLFLIGAMGTLLGSIIAYLTIEIGEWGLQAASILAGGYIGGSMNVAAISRVFAFDQNPTQFSLLLSANIGAGLIYLLFLAMLPTTRWFSKNDNRGAKDVNSADVPGHAHIKEKLDGFELANLFALALIICAAGELVASTIGYPHFGILIITILAVAAVTMFGSALDGFKASPELGMFFLYILFASYGAQTDIINMIQSAPLVLFFALLIIGIHFCCIFGLGRLFGFSNREIAIASNACVLGPPTAAALASKEGWNELVTPGILCGVFGYLIGNFVGVGIFELFH